jgi:hypothetical protein
MQTASRNPLRRASLFGIVCALAFAVACGDSHSPTAPGGGGVPTTSTGTLSGTVILGSTQTSGINEKSGPIGLGGVTVTVTSNGRSTTTDGSGQFMLTSVPAGSPELSFERQDIHARGHVTIAAGGMTTVTISIVGGRANVVPGSHSGIEAEGLVSAIDSGAGTLTVLDQRLGAVVVHTDGSTVIVDGNDAPIPLSQIAVGNRVHVMALKQADGTILASQIELQSDKVGGNRELDGPVVSVDSSMNSFVVQAGDGNVTVTTNGSTMFKRRGGPASFGDIAAGVNVEVNGILQADGTVLAKKVTIES